MNSKVVEKKSMGSYDKNLEDSLKSGYEEMSLINLILAEEGVEADSEALALAEQNLRSVKLSDS